MKKIIIIFILILSYTHTFADMITIVPYEYQCAKEVVTKKSKLKYDICMKKCEAREYLTVYCHRECGGGPEICLYTNEDRKLKTERYMKLVDIKDFENFNFKLLDTYKDYKYIETETNTGTEIDITENQQISETETQSGNITQNISTGANDYIDSGTVIQEKTNTGTSDESSDGKNESIKITDNIINYSKMFLILILIVISGVLYRKNGNNKLNTNEKNLGEK